MFPSRNLRRRWLDFRYGALPTSGPIGRRGEAAAARLLRQKGLRIIAMSESDRAGEIDIIAIRPRDKLLIFVEVKTLATTKPGHPADRVDAQKQRRIARAALRYMKRKGVLGAACRFDVVAVWWPRGEQPDRIEHYESAFDAPDDYQMFG